MAPSHYNQQRSNRQLQENPPTFNLDRPGLGGFCGRAAGHRAVTQTELGLYRHAIAQRNRIFSNGDAIF
jgi:hypothetical protein